MKSQVLSFCFALPTALVAGQNLVPNGSFEEYQNCPMTLDALYQCDHWFNALATCDYYNACNTAGLGVPSNLLGFQWALDGHAYAGLVTYDQPSSDYREVLGIELIESLTIGQETFFSFWYNRAGEGAISSRASNNLGLKFCLLDDIANETLLDNQALLKVDTIVFDTLHWYQLKGSFVPQLEYTHLVIGNFFDDANTLTEIDGPFNPTNAYFFIDDVRVSADSAFVNHVSSPQTYHKSKIRVFPSLADQWIRIDGPERFRSIEIYSMEGKLMRRLENGSLPQTLAVSNYPPGMYFIKMESPAGGGQSFKFLKQ